MGDDRTIPTITRSGAAKLRVGEIIYAESEAGGAAIHTEARTHHVRVGIGELAGMLGSPFCRCHSGLLVNLGRMHAVRDGSLCMEDGTVVLLGRRACQAARRGFIEHLRESCGLMGRQKWRRG
jgi:DNA-binding LytR/AlgR family response regulator